MKLRIIILFVSILHLGYSQTIEEIKKSPLYYWGEGVGENYQKADKEALSILISQISVNVVSNDELTKSQNNLSYNETFNSKTKTQSNATLDHTEIIVNETDNSTTVFRYIKKSDVEKVFLERKQLVCDYIKMAEEFEKQYAIGNAIKYYYWAQLLLYSLPDGNTVMCECNKTNDKILSTIIDATLKNIFANIKYSVAGKVSETEMLRVDLYITYKDKPVGNIDFTYLDGRSQSPPMSAKDGMGYAEFYGKMASSTSKFYVLSDYLCESELVSNKEMASLYEQLKNNGCNLPFYKDARAELNINQIKTVAPSAPLTFATDVNTKNVTNTTQVANEIDYKQKLTKILDAIKSKNNQSVRSLFTSSGFAIFDSLVRYGNATVMQQQDFSALKGPQGIMVRGANLSFSFKNNKKRFVEDVVFNFNNDGFIDNVSFGLGKNAISGIANHDTWAEMDRLTIINFLENYKTAYSLKRIDYLGKIFSDSALIIVGKEVRTYNPETRMTSTKVESKRYSKAQYISNLRKAFSRNEFVNIKFEDSEVLRAICGGKILYGIKLKQIYNSQNYGDEGYLFLLADLNNPDLPIIHIRTWQPNKDYTVDSKTGLYSLSSFNCQ